MKAAVGAIVALVLASTSVFAAPKAPPKTPTPSAPKHPPAKGTKRAPPARAPKGYRESNARWHAATPGKSAPKDANGRPMLVLASLNTGDRVELSALTDDGGFDAHALDLAARVLRDQRTGLEHPVEAALLDLIYRAERHFDAEEIRVISGYRAPKINGRSQHGRGRAMDVVIPGAKDEDVATWAKSLGFTGVGIYPVSGFCHLDVRAPSYFWVDGSGPGQRNRERATGGEGAKAADAKARSEGRKPARAYRLPTTAIEDAWGGKLEEAPDDAPDDDDDAD